MSVIQVNKLPNNYQLIQNLLNQIDNEAAQATTVGAADTLLHRLRVPAGIVHQNGMWLILLTHGVCLGAAGSKRIACAINGVNVINSTAFLNNAGWNLNIIFSRQSATRVVASEFGMIGGDYGGGLVQGMVQAQTDIAVPFWVGWDVDFDITISAQCGNAADSISAFSSKLLLL